MLVFTLLLNPKPARTYHGSDATGETAPGLAQAINSSSASNRSCASRMMTTLIRIYESFPSPCDPLGNQTIELKVSLITAAGVG